MKLSLKAVTQQYLNNKGLSSKQLDQLQALQEKQAVKNMPNFFSWYRVASVASLLIFSVLSIYLANSTYFSTLPIEQRIAEEVASNHLKLKPLEVKANTMQGITTYFKQLNFSPVKPLAFQLSKQNLLGARYCSIQGVTALQLRVMNTKTNKVQTLYETEYDRQIFKGFPDTKSGSQPSTIYVRGMKVDMWVEKGLLFALIE